MQDIKQLHESLSDLQKFAFADTVNLPPRDRPPGMRIGDVYLIGQDRNLTETGEALWSYMKKHGIY